ncbi:MAG: HAD family phosphatase [Cytophagales bacterium]|nr:HAD family phosphatase [Bernardetiaceae bacterium]MDW8210039.1 HAD family phosphatase [Cytophagales bacterium]
MKHIGFIFDMDGVIVDSNPYHKMALEQFCQQVGISITQEVLLHKVYGRANKEWLPELLGKELSEEEIEHYGTEKELLYQQLYRPYIRPVPGLFQFLQLLTERKFPCAVATSAPRMNVDFTLQHTGLSHFFELVLDQSHVSKGKPHPEIYLKTSAALGLPPSQCIVFEDSLAGVRAARAAGCKVVGVLTTHRAEELTEAQITIADFTNLQPEALCRQLDLV